MADEPIYPCGAPSESERSLVERKFPRFAIELPCLFSVDNGDHDWNGTVINLSRGGCAIRSTTPVQRGDYLRVLIFPGTNQPPIEAGLAPVRWATRERFGVEFLTLSTRDAQRLQGYLTLYSLSSDASHNEVEPSSEDDREED